MSEADFAERHCTNLPQGTPPLSADAVSRNLTAVPGWELSADDKTISRAQRFADFAAAIAFVNQVAEIAEAEDHHPDIRIYSYRFVSLEFATHSIGGLSDNDFIMAAKVNRLLT